MMDRKIDWNNDCKGFTDATFETVNSIEMI